MFFFWNFFLSFTRKKPRLVGSHWQTLSHNVQCCMEYTSPWTGFELTTLVVIGNDCNDYIGSCKSNYNTITATTTSSCHWKKNITSRKIVSRTPPKKIPVIQVIKRHYLPLAMIAYRPILPLTIYTTRYSWNIARFKAFLTILYSWSATKCNRT
jgi:hypothetical protein